MTGQVNWPDLPSAPESATNEMVAALFQAKVGAEVSAWRDSVADQQAFSAAVLASEAQAVTAEDDLRKQIQDAYLSTASASLDRLVKRAELLTTAAAAVGSFYSALCGLAYAATDGRPLPAAAIAPATFIAFSIVLSCVYLGFVRRRSESRDRYSLD